jgi:light-regulated signal transduction histidine kinase (bacteriophytochrome)
MKDRTIDLGANRGLGVDAILPFRADFRLRDPQRSRESTRDALLELLARDVKRPLALIEDYVDLLIMDADQLRPEEKRDVLNRIGAAARKAMCPRSIFSTRRGSKTGRSTCVVSRST